MMKRSYILLFLILFLVCVCLILWKMNSMSRNQTNRIEIKDEVNMQDYQEIYLAGGCFWGVEAYFARLSGVLDVTAGYANGKIDETSYALLSQTAHAETVHIRYNPSVISLREILLHYFRIIDPLSVNQQGNDIGVQYRTGIYYTKLEDLPTIYEVMREQEKIYGKPLAVEVESLKHYILAEDYHQDYLAKNPNGYCHINLSMASEPVIDTQKHQVKTDQELKESLTKLQYEVTRENKTEPPFQNEYWSFEEEGIYVDITSGEPLFSSLDKFDSGCGWPSFSKTIAKEVMKYRGDNSHGMQRVEIRSRIGDAHIGHVFEDGPKDKGGLRYCVNSASVRFIPKEEMDSLGYGYLLYLFDKNHH